MEVATSLLEQLSVPDADQVRLRMSWEEFLALPERPRAEWVDGVVVLNSPLLPVHGIATIELGVAIRLALPGLVVMTEVDLRLPGDRVRRPDLMALASRPRTAIVDEPVVLVAEVLSRSTRAEDLLRKAPEYAAAGVGQLWVVDPEGRSIEVSENVGGAWRRLLRLDDRHPSGQVLVRHEDVEHGVVRLDVVDILGPVEA